MIDNLYGFPVAVDDLVRRRLDRSTSPRRVIWVSEDGTCARIEGTPTGVPVTELTVIRRAAR